MIFACEFSVPKFAVLARSKKLMHVAVKFRLDFSDGKPFSCTCLLNVTHCRKEICPTCLSKASIPAIPVCKDIQLIRRSESPQG